MHESRTQDNNFSAISRERDDHQAANLWNRVHCKDNDVNVNVDVKIDDINVNLSQEFNGGRSGLAHMKDVLANKLSDNLSQDRDAATGFEDAWETAHSKGGKHIEKDVDFSSVGKVGGRLGDDADGARNGARNGAESIKDELDLNEEIGQGIKEAIDAHGGFTASGRREVLGAGAGAAAAGARLEKEPAYIDCDLGRALEGFKSAKS